MDVVCHEQWTSRRQQTPWYLGCAANLLGEMPTMRDVRDPSLREELRRTTERHSELSASHSSIVDRIIKASAKGERIAELVQSVKEISDEMRRVDRRILELQAEYAGETVDQFLESVAQVDARFYMPDGYEGPWVISGNFEPKQAPVLTLTDGSRYATLQPSEAREIANTASWSTVGLDISDDEHALLDSALRRWLEDVE